jgi:hypothetical protein
MSVIVLVLDDGIDAVVRSPEELKGVVAAIGTSFRQYLQNIKQDTTRLLNGFKSGRDVVSQKANRYAALSITPRTIWRSRAVNLKQRAISSDQTAKFG